MGVTLARSAPADASAGYLSLRYSRSGEIQFVQRIHLNTVDLGQVSTEAVALLPFLQVFYDATWLIQATALTQTVGGSEQRIIGPTAMGGGYISHVGTSDDTTEGIQGLVQTNFMFKTALNGRARLRFLGLSGIDIGADTAILANGSGTNEEKLVNYLVNTSTHIVAHDGSKFHLPCHELFVQDARKRRRSLRVA